MHSRQLKSSASISASRFSSATISFDNTSHVRGLRRTCHPSRRRFGIALVVNKAGITARHRTEPYRGAHTYDQAALALCDLRRHRVAHYSGDRLVCDPICPFAPSKPLPIRRRATALVAASLTCCSCATNILRFRSSHCAAVRARWSQLGVEAVRTRRVHVALSCAVAE